MRNAVAAARSMVVVASLVSFPAVTAGAEEVALPPTRLALPAPPPPATAPASRPATGPAAAAPAGNSDATAATRPDSGIAPPSPLLSPDRVAEADRLIRELDSDDFKTRERAAEALMDMGRAVVPHLRQAIPKAARQPEVATRLAGIVKEIEEQARYGPSLVTLDLKGASLEAAAAELSKAAGVTFGPSADDAWRTDTAKAAPVTLGVRREPFWAVLLKLCEQAGAAPTGLTTDGQVLVAPVVAGLPPPPMSASGPAVMIGQSVEVERVLLFGVPGGGGGGANIGRRPGGPLRFRFRVQAICEPKLKVDTWGVDSIEGETDGGEKLNANGSNVSFDSMNTPGQPATLYLSVGQEKPFTKLRRLSINARFVAVVKTDRVMINDVMAGKEMQTVVGGYRATIRPITKAADGGYQMSFTVQRDQQPRPHWQQFQALLRTRFGPAVEDADGKRFTDGNGSASWGGDTYQRTLTLRGVAPDRVPARIVWEVPVEFKTVPAKFEFADVPLP